MLWIFVLLLLFKLLVIAFLEDSGEDVEKVNEGEDEDEDERGVVERGVVEIVRRNVTE